ncbi:Ig-like domain-containing protein, partial [Belliella sp. DSM 107340]
MKKTFTILYLIMGLFCSGLILADNKIKIQKGFEFHHPFSSKAESPILEDFEDESINSKTFSSNGQEFTISSGNSNLFDIYNSGGDLYGWNGSSADSKFIDNSSSVDNNIDLTIATSDNKAFILKSFYLFIAQGTGVITGVNGDITIVGSKNGVTQFTNTVNSGYNTSTNSQNGYTFINMSTFGGDNNSEIEIDKFTILSTGNIRYIALDAMSWAPGVVAANCAPNHGVTDFEGFYSTFTELNSGTGSATATVACFDITSETLNPSHTARVTGTSISGNELLIIQGVGTSPNANLKRAIIKSNDGSSFSFKSIKVQPFGTFSDLQITYEGYLNGVQVSNANLDRSNMTTGTIYNDSFLSIPAFNEVDEIRIEFNFVGSSFQNFRIDDIEIGPANTATSPTVLTNAATSILASEVTLNGNISDDGGANVTARGFVYSSSDNSPILGEGGVTNVTIGSGTGAFQETIAGLSPSTTYYFQAYATNSEGTSYGGVEIFTTLNQVSAPTITSTPILTAPYSQQYNYSIVGTVDNELETTLSATTLPNWLTFSSDGQGVSSRFGDIPAWVALSGVAGDGEGNVFAIRNNGTEIFKIEPDGTTTSWKSGLTSSTVYALHIANGFVYIPRYGNSSQSITRIPLDNPNAPEEIFLSRSGGALSLTDKDGFIYAAIYNSREIIKINETTKDFEILINNQTGLSSYSPFGMTFDKNGDLFIATYGVRSIIKYDGSSVTPVLTNLPNNVSSIRNDAAGNFYLSMSGGGVRKYNADFSSFETVSVNANDNVWSLSLTAAGSLVYSRQGTNEVYRLQTGAILTGIPAKSDIGEHPVVLRAANDNGYTEQEFTITVTDETAPLLTTFSPEKNADDVELTPELTLTFDEEIVLGNIGVLSIESGGSILQSFDLAIQEERELIEVSEDRLSILVKITNPLALNTTISIGITEGFFKDDFDNDFAGFLASSNTWNFRTLNKQNQTISFPEISDKIYGDDAFILGAEETDQGLTIVYTANDPSIVSISGNQATILKAGSTEITATQSGDDNFIEATPVIRTLAIDKAIVTITAEDQSKVYGESNPSLTFAYDGLVNGDTEVSTEPSISTTATASSTTGTYPITLSGGSDANYAITLVDGTLTVDQKAVTITADDKSKIYGESNPSVTFAYDGLVNGDEKVATEPSISTTATASSDAGTYPITLSGGSDANYAITLVDGTLTVGQKAVMITAEDQSKVYGESNPSLTFAYDGLVNGDEKISTEPSISTTATASSNTGTYPITLSGGSDANYAITVVDGTLTVGQKTLTITAEDQSKVYGETNPSLTFAYDGLVNGDEKISTEPSISTTASASSNTGTYPITLSGGSDANYAITVVDGTLTVGQKAVTITADDKSKIYGESNPSLTFAYDGLVNGDEKISTEPSISTTATASSNTGTYPITLSGGSDANYAITLVDGTLTVGQKAVTITAEDQSKVYGETNPSLTFTYDGLVNGDEKVSTEPSISTTATASSNTGTYPITLSGGSDANYAITLANGTLTVGQKSLTITADNKSKIYGEGNPSLTFAYDGLVNGDEKVATEPSISTTATASSDAGTYPITLSGGTDANYAITLVDGTLTVGQKAVTITAEDQSKVYGETNPSLSFTYDGLVNGDVKVATEPSISTTATASSNTGTYPITLSGGSDANYAITLANGTLTVGQKAVTITAEDQSKVYGEINPSLTFTYDGLVNGDSKVSTEPSISTTATASSDAGTYPITLSGGTDANYAITLANGTLTVGQKSLTITADNKSKIYGESNPSLTFAYDGLVNGDEKVATEPSISTTATASSDAGTYPITLSGGSDANYAITLANGTLTVGQKAVTITAEDQSKVYGEINPSLTFTYDGLVNGDEKVSTEPSISTTATASSNTGTYPIALSGGSDANYAITLANGTLTVGQKTLTIIADDKSKIYGESNPSLTFTYDGLVNGDEKVSTEPSISTTATASSNTGTYPIALS